MGEFDLPGAEDPRFDGGEPTDVWADDGSEVGSGYSGADAITATDGADEDLDDDQLEVAAPRPPLDAEAVGQLATATTAEATIGDTEGGTDHGNSGAASPVKESRAEEPADEPVGATLGRLHQASGIPIDKLAERTGVPATTLADFFGGQAHNGAGYGVLLSTLHVLDVPTDQANTLIERYATAQDQRRNQAA